jgi:hypothetical protein
MNVAEHLKAPQRHVTELARLLPQNPHPDGAPPHVRHQRALAQARLFADQLWAEAYHAGFSRADAAKPTVLMLPADPTRGGDGDLPPQTPETVCHRCGGPNVRWAAPSPLWNLVMRGDDINGADESGGIICPLCFVKLAAERAGADLWRLYPEIVTAQLTTSTPSGRVWNAETWLWE